MLEGKKILVSGAGGQIALPLCEYLAPQNEVWGIARFSDQATRERLEQAGVTTRVVDLGRPDFGEIPQDFDYLLAPGRVLGAGHGLRDGAGDQRGWHRGVAGALPAGDGGPRHDDGLGL